MGTGIIQAQELAKSGFVCIEFFLSQDFSHLSKL